MQVTTLAIELEALEEVTLPEYSGGVIRGAFGAAFRNTSCPFPGRRCAACPFRSSCAYAQVFETPRPPDARIMRKYETIPRPFVIEPPLAQRHCSPGSCLSFQLLLIGSSINYLPYFILAFETMAAQGIGPGRGRMRLKTVRAPDAVVYDGHEQTIRSPVTTDSLRLEIPRKPVRTVRLKFLTPVRLIYSGRVAQNLDFHILLRNLIRRIGLLSYFYADSPFEIDYQGLIAQARRVRTLSSRLRLHCWQRYSARQQQLLDMDGLIGSVSYTGELTPFVPFLRIGEKLHVGKGTVFGLGKYQLQITEGEPNESGQ